MTWQASLAVHNGCFGDFLSKKYLRKFEITTSQEIKGTTVMSTFGIDITKAALFFLIFKSLYLNLRLVSNNFWTKIPKSGHCGM